MSDNLQEGIYFRHGQRPGPCWRLLLLDFTGSVGPEAARAALASLWAMLGRLREGRVDDLNPDPPRDGDPFPVTVPPGELTCLLGYGARLFSPQAHPMPVVHNAAAKRPPLLRALETTGAAPFRRLPWADPAERRQHESDVILQFIANTELAVNRAIVETAKLITDRPLPLRIVTFYDGFGRDDRRSWIDFHDGINTMTPEDRLKVIELVNNTDIPWMVGGTFLAFLRTEVNLSVWRQRLTREQQELVIGRDKLTGCPLVGLTTGEGGRAVGMKIAGCPMSGTIPHPPPPGYIDAPRPGGEPVLLASHIHRANLNRTTDPALDSSNRVYRQGYEFLEPRPDGRLSQGLNFVSFQANLGRIRDMLSRREWLGSVNMGGGPAGGEPPDETILSVIAGGFYAVPPKGEPFPGAPLFDA